MQTEASVTIDRRIDDVFQLTTNHVPQWSVIVVEEQTIDKKPGGGMGTTFRTVTEDRGQKMEFQGIVTHHDPPYASAIRLTGNSFDIEAAYVFEDVVGRTRVTQKSIVHGKGFFKILLMVFGGLMKKSSCDALQKELNGLKEFCEGYTGSLD